MTEEFTFFCFLEQAIAQQQRPIWEISDALFPDLYFESPKNDAGLGGIPNSTLPCADENRTCVL